MSVDEAKSKMAQVEPGSELGLYIKERDIYLLEEATRHAEEGILRKEGSHLHTVKIKLYL